MFARVIYCFVFSSMIAVPATAFSQQPDNEELARRKLYSYCLTKAGGAIDGKSASPVKSDPDAQWRAAERIYDIIRGSGSSAKDFREAKSPRVRLRDAVYRIMRDLYGGKWDADISIKELLPKS